MEIKEREILRAATRVVVKYMREAGGRRDERGGRRGSERDRWKDARRRRLRWRIGSELRWRRACDVLKE